MAPSSEDLVRFHLVAYTAGALILLCLLVLKFVGPPPRDFLPRTGLVMAMLLVTALGGPRSRPSLLVNVGFGFVLLFWYARE